MSIVLHLNYIIKLAADRLQSFLAYTKLVFGDRLAQRGLSKPIGDYKGSGKGQSVPRPKNQRDEFAEQYVAGIFADAGWSIYFPRKDKGFDFVVSKKTDAGQVVRPVQVKGKFPETTVAVRKKYGYRGKLTAIHDDMVLVIPLFTSLEKLTHPNCVAYMPLTKITRLENGTFWCGPAKLERGKVSPKEKFQRYFDEQGLKAVEDKNFGLGV